MLITGALSIRVTPCRSERIEAATAAMRVAYRDRLLAIAADDTIVERTVKLGSKTDFDVEVLSGEAKKGDKILVDAAKYRQSVGQKATVDTAAPGGADGAGASGASGTATSTAAAEVR